MEQVPKIQGLHRRGTSGVWYFRQRCPAHLVRPGKPREFNVSLHTHDHRVALTKVAAARSQARRFFETNAHLREHGILARAVSFKRPDNPALPALTVDDAVDLARAYYRRARAELEQASMTWPMLAEDERCDLTDDADDELARLTRPADGDTHPAEAVERMVLDEAQVRAPYLSDAAERLREYLRRAQVQLATIRLARLRGDFSVAETDALFVASALLDVPQTPPDAIIGPTIREAAARYEDELCRGQRNQKTQDRYRREIAHIVRFLGPERAIQSLRRADCIDLRETFAKLPPNFQKRLGDNGSIRSLVTSRHPDAPALQYATLEKYLGQLSRFLSWAATEDLVARNYADGLKPVDAKPDGSMAKLPFRPAELQSLFARPLYTGSVDDRYGFAKPGPNIVRRARYWAPLLSLFTGMRAGEVLQLTPNHIRQSAAGTAFIVLTPDMKLKTESAEREIPVHSMLQRIGFLAWVERRRNRPDDLLFPEVPADKYGARSVRFSKWFESDLAHLLLGDRRKKLTFHSFRHTFKDALNDAGVSAEHKDELCGWVRNTKVSARYGTGLKADVLRSSVEAVSYDLDLSHLYAHAALSD